MSEPVADAGPRWLAWALIPVSLLSNPAAAFPWGSYFFRDFSITALPSRLFTAREWAAGRWPSWNPYLHEGTFVLPAFYPGDLVHALSPGAPLISWLLTLHFPFAALAMYWLARDLGLPRRGAFVAASLYALGGLAVSSLNLYMFLQALAWAPALAAVLRRAALRGGRWVALAAAAWGIALPILALEFLGQGILLGAVLALVERPRRETALRLAAALALGTGLAAVPLALSTSTLPETARGAGFPLTDALQGELPPLALVQTFVLDLFGSPAAPHAGWWGPFFRSGSPYFLTLYLGPLALALAAGGLPALDRPLRLVLLGGALLALWFALGDRGGLAPLLQALPGVRSFRSPGKAFLFAHLAVALVAGFGFERLASGRGWRTFLLASAALGLVAGGVAAALSRAPGAMASVLDIPLQLLRQAGTSVSLSALQAVALAGAGGLSAAAVLGARLARPAPWALLVGAVAIADVARAGAAVNPQVRTSFYELLPALAAELRPGQRVFSYGIQWSPAFRDDLARRRDRSSGWIYWVNRQMLSPFVNMLDEIESAETPDLTGWAPPIPELQAPDYDPAAVARILPRLRAAAVTRVLSLDPLGHDGLLLRARVPLPGSALAVHVYELREPVPAATVACRVESLPDQERAFLAATGPGFDQLRAVALEGRTAPAECAAASVNPAPALPARETYTVVSDGPAYLVVRRSFARGWSALVDGRPAPVLRANGKYRAVPVHAGRHEVVLQYRAPGLQLGLAVLAVSGLLAGALAARPRGRA